MLRHMSSMHKETRSCNDEAEQGRRKKQFKNESLQSRDDGLLHAPGSPGISTQSEGRRAEQDHQIHVKTSCDAAWPALGPALAAGRNRRQRVSRAAR